MNTCGPFLFSSQLLKQCLRKIFFFPIFTEKDEFLTCKSGTKDFKILQAQVSKLSVELKGFSFSSPP